MAKSGVIPYALPINDALHRMVRLRLHKTSVSVKPPANLLFQQSR